MGMISTKLYRIHNGRINNKTSVTITEIREYASQQGIELIPQTIYSRLSRHITDLERLIKPVKYNRREPKAIVVSETKSVKKIRASRNFNDDLSRLALRVI